MAVNLPVDPEVAADLHRKIAAMGIGTNEMPGPLPLRPPGTFGPDDPGDAAYHLLTDDFTTTPVVHRKGCYICEDPEFGQMGLPLCRPCPQCQRQGAGDGHIPADDDICSTCGYQDGPQDYPEAPGQPPEARGTPA